MNRIEHEIRIFFNRHCLSNNDLYLVAVSGGADSIVLLHAMHSLQLRVIAAHCNFHLRGEESDGDESFVRQFCAERQIELHVTDFDTRDYAAHQSLSIEMAARELRYRWFDELRQSLHAQAIAIAHHADDSAETTLLNLCRGTGIRGISGIRPINGTIIRPLITIPHIDILQYITEQGLSYRTDSSNASFAHTRNIIRHKIMPVFKQINPSFLETMQANATAFDECRRIYEYGIAQLIQHVCRQDGDTLHISIDKLTHTPAPATLLYEIIHNYGFTRTQIQNIIESAQNTSGKTFLCSPYSLIRNRDEWTLSLIRPTDEIIIIKQEGQVEINGLLYNISIQPRTPDFEIIKDPRIAYFDADKINFPLIVRNWESGDFFYPIGLKGRKKISDFFNDQKFSSEAKKKVKMLISNDNIIWIVGHRLDERVKITNQTQKILCVRPIKYPNWI